jgi:hypothetical protein
MNQNSKRSIGEEEKIEAYGGNSNQDLGFGNILSDNRARKGSRSKSKPSSK